MSVRKFRECIEKHPIFQNLEGEDDKKTGSRKPDQLFHVQDGSLYVWSKADYCLRVTNLQLMLDEQTPSIKEFKCSSPPQHKVRSISFDESGNVVALIGSKGASVMFLPEKWRQSKGASVTYCRCKPIAERFFRTCITVRLLEAAWHPGSPTNSHLCLLLSDNTLRIFDTSCDCCQNPAQVHKLGHSNVGSSRFSLASSGFSLSSALGETVVSFVFARPIEVQEESKRILQAKKNEEISSIQVYPIYLLQGDGEVLMLLTSITHNRYKKGILKGPLTMKPPAEDNYGVGSCSILVLDCTPTVLAIATCTGKVHHCIALASDDNYDSDDDQSEAQSTRSWPSSVLSVHNKGSVTEFSPPTLYVYESVQLDCEINEHEDTVDEDIADCNVTLYRDPLLYCRYHCCTKFGIQAVVLPWIDKITSFFEADDDDKDVLDDISLAQPCAVEHIVCTKPSSSSPECAVKGVTFATNPLFGPSLLCLTADNRCIALALLTILKAVPPIMTLNGTVLDSKHKSGNLTEPAVITSDFEGEVRSILKREYTQPLLRYDASMGETLVDSEACRLMTRVTQIIRREYILKQKLANDAIIRRAEFLKQQEKQQLSEIDQLLDKRRILRDKAGELAEKYEDCRERSELLSKRLEEILKLAQSRAPVLSKAEIKMVRDLKIMSGKMKHLENQVKQVKAKNEYQTNFSDPNTTSMSSPSRASVNPTLVQSFKDILFEEGKKIEDLVKKLNQMKLVVDS